MDKVNGELFFMVSQNFGRVPSREGDIQKFVYLVLFNGLSKFAQNFTVGFLNWLSTHQTYIVVLGNFPFNHWIGTRFDFFQTNDPMETI